MHQNSKEWRFMRLRAEQLFEEGEAVKALRMMRLINREQERRFAALSRAEEKQSHQKIVSTH